MTTPNQPQGGVGGFINNLLGGAAGSLAGTNSLQASIDQLNNSINTLTNRLSSVNFGAGSTGQATRQQGPFGTQPFPRMYNPFRPQPNPLQQGIGGGGPGGAGNVSPPLPFGRSGIASMADALITFGQQQMSPLLTLNSYATTSMLGMNNGGNRASMMNMLYRQVGATPGSLNSIAFGAQDAFGMAGPLQQLGGTMNVMASNLGRAGFAATAAFGLTNPMLGASASAQLAAALYSPQFSQNMLALGYNPIRSMRPGGAPMNAGQAAQSIIRGLGLSGMNPAKFYGNIASPRAQASLSALFGSSGISNQQAAQFLEGYNQLFSRGYTANQATNLFQQAAFGNLQQSKAAQATLNKAGVTTSANDIAALKTNQSVLTGRSSTYAGGFNQAIQDSTGLLEQFNSVLTQILKDTGAGTALGFGGGFGAVMAGTSHAVGTMGTIGGLLTISKLLKGGGGAGGIRGLLSGGGAAAQTGAGGAAAGASGALAPLVAAAVPAIGGLLLGAAIKAIGDTVSKQGTTAGSVNQVIQQRHVLPTGMGSFSGLFAKIGMTVGGWENNIGKFFGDAFHMATTGGGAGAVSTSQQQRHGGNNQVASISGAAKKAVGAAETQVGVPYVYGDEIPGVGFDCSGLVQWAYKQAGISLPRTSQAMWASLKNKRVSLGQVQEGDLVFTGGSDGTASSPGHVGMMISKNQLIQAPYTGANVQVIGFDPRAWSGAARPSGKGAFVSGGAGGGPQIGGSNTSPMTSTGNRGLGGPGTNNYGSAEEIDLIAGMGAGLGSGSRTFGGNTNGSSGTPNKNASAGGGSGGSLSVPRSRSAIVAIAKRIAQQYGWATGTQWDDFVKIENQEAGWNPYATNPQSGAYGLAQALPPSKYASAGSDWRTNPETQLRWMFDYIKSRYSNPAGAWAHEQAYNWYGKGGTLGPGISIIGERGPELAMTSGGQTHIFSNAQTQYLINSIKGNVPQNPWKTDITSGNASSSHGSRSINIEFKPGSIVIHSSGQGSHNSVDASRAGREVARQIVKHINHEAVSQAIRSGEKL